MTLATVLILLALLLGFYVSWNIGANDVANAIGTSVGSGALTLRQAVIIAGILEFCGAFFFGGNVTETLERGIVNPEIFSLDPMEFVYGMLAALLATGVWLQIASFFGWPVSTTHSIVGAVAGFGIILGGVDAIRWPAIGSIVASWIISPLLGGGLAYFIFMILRRKIFYSPHPVASAKKITPYLVFALFSLLPFIILFNGLENVGLHLPIYASLGIALLSGIVTSALSVFLLRRVKEEKRENEPNLQGTQLSIGLKKALKHLERVEATADLGSFHDKVHSVMKDVQQLSDSVEQKKSYLTQSMEYCQVEKIFIWLQIITACFMAFAHGSNDVANAIGPLAAIINVIKFKTVEFAHTISPWMLVLGGVGIVFGLATWGWRVIETVGKRITELTPTRGFAAEFGAATTVVLASKLGLPISTTHTLVGAVLGVGFARGIGAINLNTIRDILLAWVITVPAGACLAVVFYYALHAIF